MKTTRFFIIAAIVGSMLAGCSKDDAKPKNAYIYKGKTTTVVWAGYYHENNKFYGIGIAPKAPTGDICDEDNLFCVAYPEAKLGFKCDLSQINTIGMSPYSFWGGFKNNETFYWFNDVYKEDFAGTNSWVKLSKNTTSGEHNFTLEFEITFEGKRLTGNYTGNFQQYANLYEVVCD